MSVIEHTEHLPTVVYTPASQLRDPRSLFASMWGDLKASRELAWRLFVRDVSAQYRQSLLGLFWAFIPPIVTGLVFIILHAQGVVNFRTSAAPYPLYVLVGTVLWQAFAQSLGAPLKAVVNAKPMLAKIRFPYEALIVAAIYGVLLNLLISLTVLAALFLFYQAPVTGALLWAPVAILLLVMLGVSMGLLLTPIGLLYTDVPAALPIITQIWFLITPIVYTPPQRYPFTLLAAMNPVAPLLLGARDLITLGKPPDLATLLVAGAATSFLLFISWLIYRIALPIIIERISA